MSQENVDVYFAAKDRLAAGDHDGFTRLIHPDVTATVANFPEPGPFLGRDALIAQLEGLAIEFHGHRYSDVEIIADRDDWIVLTYRWSVQGARSGVGVDADVAVAFRVKDRQVIEVHWRESRDEALEAAGLREWAMSQENIELGRKLVDALNRRDLDAFLTLMDADVQAHSRLVVMEGGYHGHAGVRPGGTTCLAFSPTTPWRSSRRATSEA